MWELIILGGILILLWIILWFGGNYLLPNRQESNSRNAHLIRFSPLTSVLEYYKNGQKFGTECYKDEKLDGFLTSRHKNGKKLSEGYHKDGKEICLRTQCYKNGHKKWIFWNFIFKL